MTISAPERFAGVAEGLGRRFGDESAGT